MVWRATADASTVSRCHVERINWQPERCRPNACLNPNASIKLPSSSRSPLSPPGAVRLFPSGRRKLRNTCEPYSYAPTLHKVSFRSMSLGEGRELIEMLHLIDIFRLECGRVGKGRQIKRDATTKRIQHKPGKY